MNTLKNPVIPFNDTIPGGLHPNRVIIIKGKTNLNSDQFAVNLLCPSKDIAFHLSPKFVEGYVERNSVQYTNWGKAERNNPMPIKRGDDFDIRILCTAKDYKVSFNDVLFTEFRHRLPLNSVTHLAIDGEVDIASILFEDVIPSKPIITDRPSYYPQYDAPKASRLPKSSSATHKEAPHPPAQRRPPLLKTPRPSYYPQHDAPSGARPTPLMPPFNNRPQNQPMRMSAAGPPSSFHRNGNPPVQNSARQSRGGSTEVPRRQNRITLAANFQGNIDGQNNGMTRKYNSQYRNGIGASTDNLLDKFDDLSVGRPREASKRRSRSANRNNNNNKLSLVSDAPADCYLCEKPFDVDNNMLLPCKHRLHNTCALKMAKKVVGPMFCPQCFKPLDLNEA